MKGGDKLVDIVDLEDKGVGWAAAAVFGFVTGILATIWVGKKLRKERQP